MSDEQRIIAAEVRESRKARVRDSVDKAYLQARVLEQKMLELEKLIENPRGDDEADD